MWITVQRLRALPEAEYFYVVLDGRLITDSSCLKNDDLVELRIRLRGGKGGFGSLLRSFGSQFYKSTNQDMCRDLTGRRLKDVKEEKRLQNYIEKAHQRTQEKQERLENKYRKLLEPPKTDFNDAEYSQKKQKILQETEDALDEGLKRVKDRMAEASQSCSATILPLGKRPKDKDGGSSKEPDLKRAGFMWLGIEGMEEDNESSASDEEEEEDKTSSLKKSVAEISS